MYGNNFYKFYKGSAGMVPAMKSCNDDEAQLILMMKDTYFYNQGIDVLRDFKVQGKHFFMFNTKREKPIMFNLRDTRRLSLLKKKKKITNFKSQNEDLIITYIYTQHNI